MIEQPKPSTDLFHREAAVWVNLSAALISATFAAVVAGWIAMLAESDYALQIATGAFFLMFAAIWFGLLFRWIALTNKEKPIMAAPATPTPVQKIPPIRVDISSNNGSNHDFMDFNMSRETMLTLTEGLLASDGAFSREAFVATGLLHDDEHRKIKKELIERGLLKQKSRSNPRQGTEFTSAGRPAFEKIRAALSPTARR